MELKSLFLTPDYYQKLDFETKKIIDDFLISDLKEFAPYSYRQELWSIFAKNKFSMIDSFFEILEPDDSIEFWTYEMNFVFALGEVLMRSNYTIDELRMHNWSELFKRDEINANKIKNAISYAITTGKKFTDVTDWHLVQEIRSEQKLNQEVKVRLIAPVSLNNQKMLMGVVKSRPSRSFLDKIYCFFNNKYGPKIRKF